MIQSQNIKDYLKYLSRNRNVHFTEDKLDKWASLPQEQLIAALNKLYEKLNLSEDEVRILERNFFSPPAQASDMDIKIIEPEVITPVSITENPSPPTPISIQNTPSQESSNEIKEISQDKSGSRRLYQAPAKKKSFIGFYILGGLLAIGGYLAYQYIEFNKNGYAYPLTDNIAVREQDLETSANLHRLDLFGSFMDKNGTIQSSYDQLKIIDDESTSNFYKIQTNNSFLSYLLGKDIAYVHKRVVTRDRSEWNQYKRVFQNISTDYNELDKLQKVYRKMIVQAVSKFNDLSGLVVARSCNVENKLKANAPLSIGQYVKKDDLNNIDGRFAIVRMTNGNYYTIIADKDGNVSEVKQTMLIKDGIAIPLSDPGKFKYYDPYDMTYGDFIWKSCDGKYQAKSMTEPFDEFILN